MYCGCTLIRYWIFLDFAALWVQSADLVRLPVIRHPEISVLIRKGAPGHAARSRQVILHVDNLHCFIAEGPHQIFVSGQFRWRLRQHRILSEKRIDIRSDVGSILVVEWSAETSQEEMHRFHHVVDAVPPSFFIPPYGSHARLKSVTRKASPDQQIFPLRIREQLLSLILGKIAPTHRTLLQGKLVGGVLASRQAHAGARIGPITDR